jgi:hypothetical protein
LVLTVKYVAPGIATRHNLAEVCHKQRSPRRPRNEHNIGDLASRQFAASG